ncbi:MAG: C39 family peptidase [Oscillospiraceae bacterium]|nr:C39 family peptidase [Oscillospiraceae bacterium]
MKEIIIRFLILLAAAAILTSVCMKLIERGSSPASRTSADIPSVIAPEPTSMTQAEFSVEAETESAATERTEAEESTAAEAPAETTAPPEPPELEVTTSRTVITSRARKEYDENSVYIDMKNILQLPELPTGCEITALTILLNHLGFHAEKTDLARNYLPIGNGWRATVDGERHGDSFFDYFIGDPFGRGYGCFANAIEKAAVKYIADNGGGFTVLNISGSEPDALYEYLIAGVPVICWATDGMIEPEYYESWYDYATGEKLDWYLNMHAFVLTGFNISANTVTLNDPMKGIIDYNIDRFETRYRQMYSQAVVILRD